MPERQRDGPPRYFEPFRRLTALFWWVRALAGALVAFVGSLCLFIGLRTIGVPEGDELYFAREAIWEGLRLALWSEDPSPFPRSMAWIAYSIPMSIGLGFGLNSLPEIYRRFRRCRVIERGDHLVVFGGPKPLAEWIYQRFFRTEDTESHLTIIQAYREGAEAVRHPSVLPYRIRSLDKTNPVHGLNLHRAKTIVFAEKDDEATLEAAETFFEGTDVEFEHRSDVFDEALDALDRALERNPSPLPSELRALLMEALSRESPRGPKVWAHLGRPLYWRLLTQKLASTPQRRQVPLRMFSLPSLEAKRILDRFAPGRIRHGLHSLILPVEDRAAAAEHDAPHLLVVGYNERAEAIIAEFLVRAHQAFRPPPRVTVVTADSERHERQLLAMLPELRKVGDLRFIEGDSTLGAYRERIARLFLERNPPELVVITTSPIAARVLEKDVAALDAFFPPPLVWVDRSPPEMHGLKLDSLSLADLYGGPVEQAARKTHEDFVVRQILQLRDLGPSERRDKLKQNPTRTDWWSLNEDIREDNRRQVEHALLKVEDVDWHLGGSEAPASTSFEIDGTAQNALAMAEHRRWSASRRIDGWTWGEKRDNRLRTHPSLVPYEELLDPDRERNLGIVRDLPRVVVSGGWSMGPIRRVVVLDGSELAPRWSQFKEECRATGAVARMMVALSRPEKMEQLLELSREHAASSAIEIIAEDRAVFPAAQALVRSARRVWLVDNLPTRIQESQLPTWY